MSNILQSQLRLDKFLANNCLYSRKDIKRLCRARKVMVNGAVIRDSSVYINSSDIVELHGARVVAAGKHYIMLNKPANVLSAAHDSEHLCALDLLEDYHGAPFFAALHLAGRLDLDATGLLLISDDGKWTQQLTSPHKNVTKTYLVTTAMPISSSAVLEFANGILLKDQRAPCKSAKLEILASTEARLTISEGKYHQVKRMFAALGNKVTALHREAIGTIVLDDSLDFGQYRELTQAELAGLQAITAQSR